MTTALLLPGRTAPTNLHLREGVQTRFVDSDMYDIGKRMAEISPNLYAIEATENGKTAWIVMEKCHDGVDRLVFRTPALDGRVIEKLKYLFTVDLKTRMDIIERDEFKFEADRKENELEELYERIGRPMWTDLDKCGFIDRPVSYPKRGVTGGRGSAAKS